MLMLKFEETENLNMNFIIDEVRLCARFWLRRNCGPAEDIRLPINQFS